MVPKDIKVQWKDILVDVKVDEGCSDVKMAILSNALKLQGIAIVPSREYIYATADATITIEKN